MTYRIRGARVIPAVILLFIIASGHSVYARSRDLTVSEARELVMEALESSARKLPKLAIDPYTDAKAPAPGFYEFAVTWDNPQGPWSLGFSE